jgi:hypothetical protein
MWNRDLLTVLAMLAKLMVGEGELGDDAGFAQVDESLVP